MSVLASSIITRVRAQLADEGAVKRWTDSELMRWLSDGQRAVVSAVPAATSTVAVKALDAGSRQTIPSGGYRLIRVVRNLTSGGVAGPAITEVSWDLLDLQYPAWHESATADQDVKAYAFDPRDPTAFYVFPSNNGTGSVQVLYSALPVEISSLSANLSVQDIYQTPLFDYVMYRAHQKDSDFAAGRELAASYLEAFTSLLTILGAQAQGGQ